MSKVLKNTELLKMRSVMTKALYTWRSLLEPSRQQFVHQTDGHGIKILLRIPTIQGMECNSLRNCRSHIVLEDCRNIATASRGNKDDEEEDRSLAKDESVEKALVESVLRVSLLAQEAVEALAWGISKSSSLARPSSLVSSPSQGYTSRPDVAAVYDRESETLKEIKKVSALHSIRPSIMSPATKFAFRAVGLGAGCTPRLIGAKIVASGMNEAVAEVANENIRQLTESRCIDSVHEVRDELKRLRDQDRTFEGSPKVPDVVSIISNLHQAREYTMAETAAMVVKFGTKLLLHVSKSV